MDHCTCRFVSRLDKAALAFLQDHSVQGRRILPATAMLETAAAACGLLHDGIDAGVSSVSEDTSFLRALVHERCGTPTQMATSAMPRWHTKLGYDTRLLLGW